MVSVDFKHHVYLLAGTPNPDAEPLTYIYI